MHSHGLSREAGSLELKDENVEVEWEEVETCGDDTTLQFSTINDCS